MNEIEPTQMEPVDFESWWEEYFAHTPYADEQLEILTKRIAQAAFKAGAKYSIETKKLKET